MSKIVLPSLGGGHDLSGINTNFQSLATELQDKVLYRDNPSGEPNQMENNLDMNSNSILNVLFDVNPTDGSLVNKKYVDEQVAIAIESIGASFTGFVDGLSLIAAGSSGTTNNTVYNLNTIYGIVDQINAVLVFVNGVYQYGSSFSLTDPVVTFSESLDDNDSIMFIIVTKTPVTSVPDSFPEQNAVFPVATGGQTVFDLSTIFATGVYFDVSVYVNGVYQEIGAANSYTRSTNIITFISGLTAGDSVSVITRIQ